MVSEDRIEQFITNKKLPSLEGFYNQDDESKAEVLRFVEELFKFPEYYFVYKE